MLRRTFLVAFAATLLWTSSLTAASKPLIAALDSV